MSDYEYGRKWYDHGRGLDELYDACCRTGREYWKAEQGYLDARDG